MYVLPVLIVKSVKFGGALTYSEIDKAVSMRFLALQVRRFVGLHFKWCTLETVQTMITEPKEIEAF